MAEFISRCIDKDPTKRPTATELINSEFLKNLDDEKNKKAVNVDPREKRLRRNCRQ